MDDPKFTSKERFSHLEDKLYRVSEFFKTVLKQNQELKEELASLNRRFHELEKGHSQLETKMEAIREEKDLISERVRTILAVLDSMEKR